MNELSSSATLNGVGGDGKYLMAHHHSMINPFLINQSGLTYDMATQHHQQQQPQYNHPPPIHHSAPTMIKNDVLQSTGKPLPSPYDISNRQASVEVNLISQDDNWGDNTTAITGNTSDHSGSFENIPSAFKAPPFTLPTKCQSWTSSVAPVGLYIVVFLSPILMIVLPKLDLFVWKTKECGPECDGLMISFVFKLLILLIGSWAVTFRQPRASLPRVHVYRTGVLVLTIFLIIAYWLFYSARITDKRLNEEDVVSYYSILLFSISLVDALLFIHYLAVILIEIRHLNSQYFIKVVRSPDGHARCYSLGTISIQRASVFILEKYYQDFPVNNRCPTGSSRRKSSSHKNKSAANALKYYDLDESGGPQNSGNEPTSKPSTNSLRLNYKSILAQNTEANAYTNRDDNGSMVDHNGRSSKHYSKHRVYDEYEYEKRLKRRQSRLLSVTDDAFNQIKRTNQGKTPQTCHVCSWFSVFPVNMSSACAPMSPKEAAQTIFPSIAKTLQKFLRFTRQQHLHTAQSILDHLNTCLVFDLSPQTFIEKYMGNVPVFCGLAKESAHQSWNLICDTLLTRSIESGTMFVLRQGDVSLLVTISEMPFFTINEEVLDPKHNQFVFKLNSETSV